MLQDLALKGLARLSSEKRVASKELVASKERVASTAAGGTAMEPSTNMAYVHWLLGKTPFKESVKELPCNAVVPRASDGYALKVLKELNWCHATKQNTMDSIEPEYVLLMELSFFVFTDIAMGGSRGAQEILADLDLSVDRPVEDILKNWRDKLPPTNKISIKVFLIRPFDSFTMSAKGGPGTLGKFAISMPRYERTYALDPLRNSGAKQC